MQIHLEDLYMGIYMEYVCLQQFKFDKLFALGACLPLFRITMTI